MMQSKAPTSSRSSLAVKNPSQSLSVVTIAFIAIAMVFSFSAYVLYTNIKVVREHQRWVAHTYEVLREIELTVASIVDAETGHRGYHISGDEKYLEPYQQGRARFESSLQRLKSLTVENEKQQNQLESFEILARQKLKVLEELIETRRDKGREAAVKMFNSDQSKVLMDGVRASANDMTGDELRLLDERSRAANESAGAVDQYFTLVTVGNFILLFLSWVFVRRHLARRAQDAWIFSGQARLASALTGDLRVGELCHNALALLTEYLNVPVANFYLAGEKNLTLCAGFANGEQADHPDTPQVVAYGAGLLGEAARQRRVFHLSNAPESYVKITSSAGKALATHLIIKPIEFRGSVKGVIELASFSPFKELHLKFLEQISEALGAALESAQSRAELRDLLEKTTLQAAELQAQEEELRASNEELENRAGLLRDHAGRLQMQQEELAQTNEELEMQAETLESQKRTLSSRNDELETVRHELERRALELEQASRYKSEFLANMSHELRTPLNSLLILATLLAENRNKHLDEREIDFAKTIHRSGTDLLNLINDILDLSKVEAGKLELNIEPVDLRLMVENLDSSFRHQAEAKGLKFDINADDLTINAIESDRQRLEQILKNLLSNAVKFTAKGSVALTIADDNSRIKIAVKDTGIGIPLDKQQSIFEAFQQADGSTSREFGGTGLGLTISRELAHLLGAEISLESKPGSGSKFTLAIPVKHAVRNQQEKRSRPSAAVKIASVSEQSPTRHDDKQAPSLQEVGEIKGDLGKIQESDLVVLIVEDDEDFAKTLLELAHEAGFKGLVVGNGDTALHALRTVNVHGVVLDVKLPGASGLSVLERIKANPKTRHLPIHMISGVDYGYNALKLGAIGYLVKPVSVDQIKTAFSKIENVTKRAVKRVLICEDDATQREAIRHLIGNGDVKVFAVGTGKEALDLLATDTFDCLVLDLKLPDITGFELLDKLEQSDISSKPPVVVYTGKDLSKSEIERLSKFSDSIVIKGARSPERLLDEVGLFLHRVESRFPENSRKILKELREKEQIFDGKTVMVVDDDMRNVYALVNALESRGLNIVTARNGQEAIDRLFADSSVSLVLMDIMMPHMDGYEAMRRIRADGRFRKLPIIALTAKAMKGDHEKCLAAGASDYMSKPVDLERLISLLRVWLPAGGGI